MNARLTIALIAAGACLAGCASKFTRSNYDMVKEGVDDRMHVREVMGDPDQTIGTAEWYYEDKDGYAARIHFSEDGTVIAKEWMDGRTGEWSGRNPHADAPAAGEVRERSTRTRRVDVEVRDR